MPSLTPLTEGSEALSSLAEGAQSLSSMSEGSESLSSLVELVYASTTRLGFFPDTALVEAPYPYPGSSSYPGDTTGSTAGDQLSSLAEGSLTLAPLTEI